MRQRSQTIGNLGRAPARATKTPSPAPPTLPPREPVSEPGAVRRWLHSALFDNVALKFLSFVLAVTVFLLVNTDRDSEIVAHVKVAYSLPDDKVLTSERLDEVRVTLKGSWRRLRQFDDRDLEKINLDLRRAQNGEIAITPEMIRTAKGPLPAGVSVGSISPSTLRVVFERRKEKVIEVAPSLGGHPQHGYVVTEAKAMPGTVTVRGAEGSLANLPSVRTRDVSVEHRVGSFVEETDAVPPDGMEIVGSPRVTVHVVIDEALVTWRNPDAEVAIRGDAEHAKWTIEPSHVEVALTGPLLLIEKARASLVPIVHISPNESRGREAEVSLEGVPAGIGARISPERVKVAPPIKNP
jgi:YbbR domain-containing protein